MPSKAKPKTSAEARERVAYWEAKRLEAEKVLHELEEQERRKEAERIAKLKDTVIDTMMAATGFDDIETFIAQALPSLTKLATQWRAQQPDPEPEQENEEGELPATPGQLQ